MNIVLGTGPGPGLNLAKLMETRMLLTASSGGGKSWAFRRLIEQTHGEAQQIIIDSEGEFASLREKLDLVIAAPHDGDALAHPKTAKLLAERLLLTHASAVLDIYDLKKHERGLFVKIFFEALMAVRKDDYRPLLIFLDEAHVFCPESGKDVSEATGAVIDVATRGRKRGYCLVAATQRIAKFNKDAAAELHNKLVGFTGLDTDRKRAGDEMGFSTKDQVQSLRALEAGTFYAYGPAFDGPAGEVHGLKIGSVKTTHPKLGEKQLRKPPAPTAAIKKLLPQLADLPKEAEAEAKSLADLRKENAALKAQVTRERKQPPVSRAELKAEYERGREAAFEQVASAYKKGLAEGRKLTDSALKDMRSRITSAIKDAFDGHHIAQYTHSGSSLPYAIDPAVVQESFGKARPSGDGVSLNAAAHPSPEGKAPLPRPRLNPESLETIEIDIDFKPTKPQQQVIDALAWLATTGQTEPTRETVSAVAQKRGGNYTNILGELKRAGVISIPKDGCLALTADGAQLAYGGDADPDSDLPLWDRWLKVLTEPQKGIMKTLHDEWPEPMSREELSEACGKRGGNYTNLLGELRRLGAIEIPREGYIGITKNVIPE